MRYRLDQPGLDALLATFAERIGLQQPRRVDAAAAGGAAALIGDITVADRQVTLQVVLGASFPLQLPRFFLKPWDALGLIPHVDQRGFVCFADTEGLVLDRRNPLGVLEYFFAQAVCILEAGVRGDNAHEFANEFENYWSRLPGVEEANNQYPSDSVIQEVAILEEDGKPVWIGRHRRDVEALAGPFSDSVTVRRGIYLPLERDYPLVPPRYDQPLWTPREMRHRLTAGLSKTNARRLATFLTRHARGREYVVVRLPRPDGGDSLFGIRFEGVTRQHPLLQGGRYGRAVPLHVRHYEREYLVPRGGGRVEMSDVKVLLVGCGAIGGHVAFELARAGIGTIALADADVLTEENTYRHVLGREYWGWRKVDALQDALTKQFPFGKFQPTPKRIEDALQEGTLDLVTFDLCIVATGNPTLELWLNERLHSLGRRTPMIFTWLEPLGIGGHVLLTGNENDVGCLECLYTNPQSGETQLACRVAFARPEQPFGRALTGCGSLHTPYGSLDAVQTAVLAVRTALGILTGTRTRNVVVSWRGDATEFTAAGFELSLRFGAPESALTQYSASFSTTYCRVCGQVLANAG